MLNTSKIGQIGEQVAAKYLISKGYQVIAANQRQGHKEIDLVCRLGDLTVLVEVKTASHLSSIRPEDMLSALKIKKLKQATLSYCQEQRLPLNKVRFDFVAISLNLPQKMAKIKHLDNIF